MEEDNNNINNSPKSRHIPAQILCDPTQSKCMSRFRKSPLFMEIYRKIPRPKAAARTLYEPAQSKCILTYYKSHPIRKFIRNAAAQIHGTYESKRMSTCHKSPFLRKSTGKMPQPKTTAHTLCEPARSKCTSTCHKSHFIRKFTRKMPVRDPLKPVRSPFKAHSRPVKTPFKTCVFC